MNTRHLIILAALAALLALPSLASAHTGTVACGPAGVTFSYEANFAHDTTVTEIVKPADADGVIRTFDVPAGKAVTDTIPAPATQVTASAFWRDGTLVGTINPVALTGCTQAPPPVCIPSVTVTRTVYTPGPETVQYVTAPAETTYVDRWHTKVVYRTRVKWKTRVKLIRYTPVKTPKRPIHHQPGVTG